MAEKPKHTPQSIAAKVVKALLKVKPKGPNDETLEKPDADRNGIALKRRKQRHPKAKTKGNPTRP
jgi:hypothetical protein